MSIAKPTLLGEITGSLDNITFSRYKGKIVVKRKVSKDKDRNKMSKRQIGQQKKFGYTSEFAYLFYSALLKAYPGNNESDVHKIFMKINKNAVKFDQKTFVTEVDYSKFLCSDGDLLPPEVIIKKEDEKSVFTVELLRQKFTPLSRDDDFVYVLFLDPTVNKSNREVFLLGTRNEPGTHLLKLNEKYHYCMTYVFAVSANGKNHSPSVYNYIDLGYDFINLKKYPSNYIVSKGGEVLHIQPSNEDLRNLDSINNKDIRQNTLD